MLKSCEGVDPINYPYLYQSNKKIESLARRRLEFRFFKPWLYLSYWGGLIQWAFWTGANRAHIEIELDKYANSKG
jgi:hypothetical protein